MNPPAEREGASAGDVEAFSSVKVTGQGEGKVPKVEFKAPITVTQPTIKVINEGDGNTVAAGQSVSIRLVALKPEDASVVGDNYSEPEPLDFTADDAMKESDRLLYDAIVGSKVGADIALMVPAPDAGEQPQGGAQPGQAAQFYVFTIEDAKDRRTRAEGDAVEPVKGLPSVTLSDDGEPTIEVPKAPAPAKLVSQDLIKGKGDAVKATDTLTVQYRGVKWSNGETFDSSWSRGGPTEFPLSGVVQGWQQGLAGKTVGSQVLLVVPPALGYGKQPEHELAKETLVFVVDILDAK